MDNKEEEAMEIDDPLPVSPIIERQIPTEDRMVVENAQSIVILDDEDESNQTKTNEPSEQKNDTDGEIKEIIDLVDKPKSLRCLNVSCSGLCSEFIYAPDFCLSSYRVKKSSSNKAEICMKCYYDSVQEFDKLATCLKDGELLFDLEVPVVNETLQIDDSDEEDEDVKSIEFIADNNFTFISENIESILRNTIDELNMPEHVNKERSHLEEEVRKIGEGYRNASVEAKAIRQTLDRIQIDLYNQFRPEIRNLKGITILDDFSISNDMQIRPENVPEILPRKSTRIMQKPTILSKENSSNTNFVQPVIVPKDLPVTVIPDRPEPRIDEIYYIAKENYHASWIKARLQQIIRENMSYKGVFYDKTHYRLVELKQQKERILEGKFVAYFHACRSRLTVGTRVLSQFKELNPEAQKPRNIPYYAGIVGENPVESNKYRYLIFFDIGYSQYVDHTGVNLVFEGSKNVWEDMPEDSRSFIQKYLQSQDRPMVKLSTNQTVRVEYNGKWWLCTVKGVDCSLVRVHFNQIDRWEWIYRGSTRLSPMFREEMAATNRHTGLRNPRKLGANESAAVVQYTRNADFVESAHKDFTAPRTRAVARKSTTKLNSALPTTKYAPYLLPFNTEVNITGPASKVMYFTPRNQQVQKREYTRHECGPDCKSYLTHNFTKLRGHNPLSKPLLCGWARMTFKDKFRKNIVYKAPCGRMIRSISEVHKYLRATESEMTVDLFDFNHMVRCLADFKVECNPDTGDLSKGLEQVPIPVINGFNNDVLDFSNYSNIRVPMKGVYMNLDEEFLCGCDCDDDCADKLKCSCWKLTLDGIKYLGKNVDPLSVGYTYRRLQEQVITGIYECNSRCKCSSTCLNRVAQNPMSLKLQVFRTVDRGWGIRCVNDIPQGTFVCIYAGALYPEQTANEDGLQYGDEYFAELDYIEIVEKYKEEYEEEALEDEEFEKEKTPPRMEEIKRTSSGKKRHAYDDDNDFTLRFSRMVNVKTTDEGIRSRLRKRKEEDEKKPKEEESKKDNKNVEVKEDKHNEEDLKTASENIPDNLDTVTISDDEDDGREVLSFNPMSKNVDDRKSKYTSVRQLFGPNEKDNIYIMDAKTTGNIGRFLNHSCSPNVFVQNVFVDTHDLRFPWVAFFSSQFIRAGTELTWNYNYDIGSVPGRELKCYCASLECKQRLL
ncbi:hypothetical protein ABEB36_007279 [Hypothenemus hampei]|uniref:Histone-lysine N-methyltransferase eggless n=1 Tax=Hypothenemus hampei TaxID=57062 RepID=A0ABD1ETK7_HYPHA